MYDDDNDKEDLDFYELTQVLVMGKKWGDPPECEGYTRAERMQILKQQVLMREVKEESIVCSKVVLTGRMKLGTRAKRSKCFGPSMM